MSDTMEDRGFDNRLIGKVTPEEVNALPEHIRRYVRDIETICDPAGMVQEIAGLRMQVEQLTAALTAAYARGVEQEQERCANIVWEVTKYMGIHEKQGTLVAELEQAIRHPQCQPPKGGKE